jgi:hypothetical protein
MGSIDEAIAHPFSDIKMCSGDNPGRVPDLEKENRSCAIKTSRLTARRD